MYLFKKLLSLNNEQIPVEDFFTEIFAYLLKTNPEILHTFLDSTKAPLIDYEQMVIDTQRSFEGLENHLAGSRPDIFLELFNKNEKQWIFIESKIDAQEGYQQLTKYAEHLDNSNSIQKGVLIYITKYFEPKKRK